MSHADPLGATRCRRCGSTLNTSGLAGICLRCLALDALKNQEAPDLDSMVVSGFTTGRTIGDYELLEEVGHGGMGVVFKARQKRLDRLVAVKMLRAGWLARSEELARFRSEAKLVGGLHHPNIVAIHEVGEHDGQPYFSMDFVAGRTLEEIAKGQPLPPARAANYVRRIAEAIQYAHQHGVLHRDLKPSNVLVDGEDAPRVTDFGLAKHIEGDTGLTLSGQVLGTPNFMAPEQADPRRGQISIASDIYSLGAILYQLLTGRPPFMAESISRTLQLVAEGVPTVPHLLKSGVDSDIETICLKCLEKDPQRRYASARELADELGRYLRGEPILARPVGSAARVARWCRRKPALALALGAAAFLMVVIVIGSPIAIIRIYHERKLAEAAGRKETALRIRAEAAEQSTQWQLYTALLEQARATTLSGEMGHRFRALDAVRRASAISNSAALRGAAISALALPDLQFEREWPLAPQTTMIVLDPAFERIALCEGTGPVQIRSVLDRRVLVTLPPCANLPCYWSVWSPDGRYLALTRDQNPGGLIKDVEVWNITQTNLVLLSRGTSWGSFSFHPHLPRILVAEGTNAAVTWDLETGREVARLNLEGPLRALKFSPDGERIGILRLYAQSNTVSICRYADGAEITSSVFTNQAHSFNWETSGKRIAVPDYSGTIHLLDAATGEGSILGRHKAEAAVAEFTPDGRYLFTGGWEREMICWEVESMRRVFTVGLDSYRIQFRRDGKECAILRWPEVRLQLHAFTNPTLHREFAEPMGNRRKFAAFSPDGRWLAASGGNRVAVWDLLNSAPGTLIQGPWNTRVAFSPDGELFADRAGAGFRWRFKLGTNAEGPPQVERLPLVTPPDFISLCPITKGVILTSKRGSSLVPYDRLATHDDRMFQMAYGENGASPDGRWMGTFSGSAVDVHKLPSFEHVAMLTNHSVLYGFQFSPDSREIALCGRQGIGFWNTSNWHQTRSLTNFTDVLYSTDPRTFWLSTGMRTAGLYDTRTLDPILPLPPGTLPLALSPDGRSLAVYVDARRIQLWDLEELHERLGELGLDWGNDEPGVKQISRQVN